MSNTTNINELPTDPVNGGNIGGNNMNLTANEKIDTSQNIAMQQMVSELSQASENGGTELMSRDIPTNTNNITQDPRTQPNYIEPTNNRDYIKEEEEEYINNIDNSNNSNDLEKIYEEMQVPILLSVIYFLFQLPAFKKILFNYFPYFFSSDGNPTLNGLFFTSILFGLLFYVICKLTNKFKSI